jgi:MFS family permease
MVNPLFPRETQAVISLTALYMLRMLGLFMVLPVFRLYATHLQGSTLLLIGLAAGIYGLSQAILQIPFSLWSDRIGRRPVIIAGLLIFAAGSVVAALADDIYTMILGRFMQGAGAISGALMAYVADLTSEKNRSKAMAAIGASIGVSFGISMILGPMLSAYGGLSPIFWITALLSLLGIVLLWFAVPDSPKARYTTREVRPIPELLGAALKNPQLLRLNTGIFTLHFVLMTTFLVLPVLLQDVVGISSSHHWQAYLPLMFFSFLAMLPFMIMAEKKGAVKTAFVSSIAVMLLALLLLPEFIHHGAAVLTLYFLFFAAFNFLEAMLPSLVSKTAPVGARGTAMGIYSTSQFMGAFFGGLVGGALLQYGSMTWLLLGSAALTAGWLVFACSMEKPQPLKNQVLILKAIHPHTEDELLGIMGVEEVLLVPEQHRAYLKVNEKELDRETLAQFGS